MRLATLLIMGLLLAGCSRGGGSAQAPAQAAPAAAAPAPVVVPRAKAPTVTGERTPLGEPPRPVTEPAAMDRSSPGAVLSALQSAIERGDAASIARLRSQTAEKATLDSRDLLRAKLDFLGEHSNHWRRVFAKVDSHAVATLGAEGTQAVLHVNVGGALGSVDLSFVKKGDAWLAGF